MMLDIERFLISRIRKNLLQANQPCGNLFVRSQQKNIFLSSNVSAKFIVEISRSWLKKIMVYFQMFILIISQNPSSNFII